MVSELLPRHTQGIHAAILETGRRRSTSSGHSSCTCYQCSRGLPHLSLEREAGSRKISRESLVQDINSNLVDSLETGERRPVAINTHNY